MIQKLKNTISLWKVLAKMKKNACLKYRQGRRFYQRRKNKLLKKYELAGGWYGNL